MAGRLSGKSAIITGAASGQGRVAASVFAAEGALLTLADVDGEGLEETAIAVREAGGDPLLFAGDLTDEPTNEELVRQAIGRFGHIDVLYNAAGFVRFAPLHEMSLEDWRFVIDNELTLVFLTTKHVIRAMLERGKGGSIINVSSGSGYHSGTPRHAAHAATKAAIAGLTKQIAVEYGPEGIRCNAIAPGFLVYAEGQRRVKSQSVEMPATAIPLGRHVTPDDTAQWAAFLASDDSPMVTGQVISVDGGSSAGRSVRAET
ncbi:MAG: SDR family oxidoreductase [Chloroflexi bacterium]|nr:SDR family oxidoreductase [Chloroflexota bacterium]